MKVVIIEDEVPAAEKLERYLLRYDDSIEVLDKIQSVKEAILWFHKHLDKVELIFMDIQLLDGQSFSIFEKVNITKPIIFTTAYDDYAVKAFEVNSIGYLLKPINFPDLCSSIEKYKLLSKESKSKTDLSDLLKKIETSRNYKTRFMIKIGEHIRAITTHDIIYFYAEGRNAYIANSQGRRLIIDYKLEELEEILDPGQFYRVNRTYIVNINAISDVLVYSNSRLKVITTVKSEKEIIVTREKVTSFKKWFAGD